MTSSYYFNNIIPNSGYNNYNTTGNPLYYYTIGNNQDNFGVTQSKYSTITAKKPKTQYYNQYTVGGNNMRIKLSPNVIPQSNAYNIVTERRTNNFIYPNNYQQKLNYAYSAEKVPKYSTKTTGMNFHNFNNYGMASPKITIQRPTSPQVTIQRMNSGSSNISPNLENIQNNVNLYSPVMSPSPISNDNQNSDEIINNEKFENEEQIFNNNTNITPEDINFVQKTQEINDAFLNTQIQLTNDSRPSNNQLLSSAHFPNKTLNININNDDLSKYLQSNNNNQILSNTTRYSYQQKKNTEYQSPPNFSTPKKKETLAHIISPRKGLLKINGEIINDNSLKEFYREMKGGIVESYAYYEDSNSAYREYMEDKGKSIENFKGDQNKILFCIFDGHGGGEVSTYLQVYFGQYMKQIIPFKHFPIDFKNLFKALDQKVKSLDAPQAGATATIAYIERVNGKRILYVANVGDSRCVLVKKNRVIRMSYDDRVDDNKEHNRIIKQGGVIYNERIYGQLMLSRCFGDWNIKEYGVIVEPHISKTEITDEDSYLIIASDGVWDAIKDEECLGLTKTNRNTFEICKNIVAEALNRGSQDNISCFVIKLN